MVWLEHKRRRSLAADRAALGSLGIIGFIINGVIWDFVVLDNLGHQHDRARRGFRDRRYRCSARGTEQLRREGRRYSVRFLNTANATMDEPAEDVLRFFADQIDMVPQGFLFAVAPNEGSASIYVVRLLAFLLIIAGILYKRM